MRDWPSCLNREGEANTPLIIECQHVNKAQGSLGYYMQSEEAGEGANHRRCHGDHEEGWQAVAGRDRRIAVLGDGGA